MCRQKNSENRLIFGEDTDSDNVGRFFWDRVYWWRTEELPMNSLSCSSLWSSSDGVRARPRRPRAVLDFSARLQHPDITHATQAYWTHVNCQIKRNETLLSIRSYPTEQHTKWFFNAARRLYSDMNELNRISLIYFRSVLFANYTKRFGSVHYIVVSFRLIWQLTELNCRVRCICISCKLRKRLASEKEVNEDCFGTSFCTCRWKVTCISLWKEVKNAAFVGLLPYMPLQSGT